MKHAVVAVLMTSVALAGCGRDREPAPPEPAPSPLADGEQAQASIIRPDIAMPTEAPAALEPLNIVIGFPDGGAKLSPDGTAALEKLVASPQVRQGGAIRIGAHSDSAGTDTANLAASRKRGQTVLDWLLAKGIAEERVTLVAFGEQNPDRPNALPDGTPDEAGRAANRRVEINVAVKPTSPETRAPTLAEEIVDRTGSETTPSLEAENSD